MSALYVKLQAMLIICKEFRMLRDLKFNVFKSYACCVGRSRPEISVQFLKNRALLWVDYLYLGMVFNTKHEL